LRRSGVCTAAGLGITLAMLASQGVSASSSPGRLGPAGLSHVAVRWSAAHVVGRALAAQSASGHVSWRVIYRARTPMSLLAVAALGPHDAWAVGYTQRNNAVALHRVRGRWQRIPIPHAYQFFPQYVAGSSARDVWIFGYRNTATGQPWQALRWDGRAWHQVPPPPDPGVPNEVGFLVLGQSNVWFPSQSSCRSSGGVERCWTPVCRWNGRSWVVYRLNSNVTGLAASGPRNIWAVGFRLHGRNRYGPIARPVTYRWTGTVWRGIRMPRHAITGFHNGGPVIDTSGPRAVWIGSEAEDSAGGALLMHWNGRRWRQYRLRLSTRRAVSGHRLGPTGQGADRRRSTFRNG
jgi:hypothetical protein